MTKKGIMNGPIEAPASAVDIGKIPSWLSTMLKEIYPSSKSERSSVGDYQLFKDNIERLFGRIGVDHWGTTTWHGVKNCFVTEPYGVDQSEVEVLKWKGRKHGFAVVYEPISHHFPGNGCERVLIFPTDLCPFTDYEPQVLAALREVGTELNGSAPKLKDMKIRESSSASRAELEHLITEVLGRSKHFLLDNPIIIEKVGPDFILKCSKVSLSEVKKKINVYKKYRKDLQCQLPVISAKLIDDDTLIPSGENAYDSNEGEYVSAIYRRYVVANKIERTEAILKNAIGKHLLGIDRSERQKYNEFNLTIRLSRPISGKNRKRMLKILDRALSKVGDCGQWANTP